jgi:hypothetical protein
MDVMVSGASSPGGTIYFDTNGYNGDNLNGDTIMGHVYLGGVVNSGYGPVTGFATAVPEPETYATLRVSLSLAGPVNPGFRAESRSRDLSSYVGANEPGPNGTSV